MNMTTEPVATTAAIQVLIVAVLALNSAFGWASFTDGQTAAILGVYAALTLVLASVTRGKVSPVDPASSDGPPTSGTY